MVLEEAWACTILVPKSLAEEHSIRSSLEGDLLGGPQMMILGLPFAYLDDNVEPGEGWLLSEALFPGELWSLSPWLLQ